MKPVKWHRHSRSQEKIYGSLLQKGDVIRSGDKYDGLSGKWEDIPSFLIGTPLAVEENLMVVRPAPL